MIASSKILIVEDDPAMQTTLARTLEKDSYTLFLASNFKEGRKFFESVDPDVVLLDINLPDRSGRELFDLLKAQNEEATIIILTAFPDLRSAIGLMKAGAFDYLVKPFDLTELKLAIRKGLELKNLKNEVIRLKRKEKRDFSVDDIIGVSGATCQIRKDILKIANAGSSTILITGESGTGKELVAQALHAHSPRASGPLVAINCSAIPDNLVESELFGHEKGAFTDATQTVKGVFELASGGTLFLDEIGELPAATQPKLLRACETSKIKRLGGTREIPIDIRLIAATNKNLAAEVEKGFFREDLYYRFNVLPLVLTPLRDRPEDIVPLIRHLVAEIGKSTGLPTLEFTQKALDRFQVYAWPGNVRELKNLLERLMIIYGSKSAITHVDIGQLPEEIRIAEKIQKNPDAPEPAVQSLAEVERKHILMMMGHFNGNKSEVSRRLGISRNTLKNKLRKNSISQ